jgi:hypothetical protein
MGIPDIALAEMANLWSGDSSPAPMTHIAVGSGDTAFAADDETLGTEITDSGLDRSGNAATVTRATTSTENDTVQLVTTFTVTGTNTIKEVGIFTANAAGVLGGRTVLTAPKDVVNGSSYTCTYKTIFARE